MSAKINPEDAANIIEQIGNYIKKFDVKILMICTFNCKEQLIFTHK